MAEASDIIKRPLITEKATWESGARNRYSFVVDLKATKDQIKRAVADLYKVRVEGVSTQVRKGKNFRTRYGTSNTGDWKKAVVQVHQDDRIDLF